MLSIKKNSRWLALGVALAVLSGGSASAAPIYTLSDLGVASLDHQNTPVGGGFNLDGPSVISFDASGQVAHSILNTWRIQSGNYTVENGVPDAFFSSSGNTPNPIVAPPGHPGNWSTFAFGINNSGTVAGVSFDGVSMQFGKALMYTPSGGPQLIPTLDGTNGAALGINDLGQIVGQSPLQNDPYGLTHAFLGSGGSTAQDLNTLIASGLGLTLVTATGINNVGQIVGLAFDSQHRTHEYILAPLPANTPEPTALVLGGLVALWYGARGLARRGR